MSDTATSPALLPDAHDAPCHIGMVALRVRDLAGLTAFYRDTIGLALLEGTARVSVLGVDGHALVRLEAGAVAPTSAAGLFHLALLLPSRQALANWLAYAATRRIRLDGASDHLVSEALYLSDPEGNGIEIYRDRARADWPRRNGEIVMATDRLDLDALLSGAERDADAGMPTGTRMGHVHLRVGDTQQAEAFYRDALGFDLTLRYPGASFLSSGGYHHHIAANIWNSRGAGARGDCEAGLDFFTLVARDAQDFEALRARMLATGGRDEGKTVAIADPWGNRIVLER